MDPLVHTHLFIFTYLVSLWTYCVLCRLYLHVQLQGLGDFVVSIAVACVDSDY